MKKYDNGVILTRRGELRRCRLYCEDEEFRLRINAVVKPISGYFQIMKHYNDWLLIRILRDK